MPVSLVITLRTERTAILTFLILTHLKANRDFFVWFDRPSRQTNECEILHFLRHAFENMLLFFMRTNLIKARGTHTPIHGLGVELTLQGVLFTRLCSKRAFETRVSPVHWPDGFVIWWASIRAIQLSMAATARVKWLCACVGWCMCLLL